MGKKKIISVEDLKDLKESKRINSPRTLEACLRSGLEPDELKPKPVEAFVDTSRRFNHLEREAAQIRYNHYEQCRQQKLKLVRKERNDIIKLHKSSSRIMSLDLAENPRHGGKKKAKGMKGSVSTASLSNTERKEKEENVDSTMIALEERRLGRIKARQEREMEMLLDMESKMGEIQQQNNARELKESKRKELWEKERQQRRALAVQQKHERELKKKMEEEGEARRRRELAKREAEKEKQLLLEEQRREKKRQQEAALKERERLQKAEDHRRQTESLLKAQEQKAMENRNRMIERERVVQEKMRLAQVERQKAAEEKRLRTENRLKEALLSNKRVMQQRKEEFDKKQSLANERTKVIKQREKEAAIKRKEVLEKESQLRESRLKQARELQQENIRRLVTRRAELEEKLSEVYDHRRRDHYLKWIEKQLKLEDKRCNVERIKKVDEFIRNQTLLKIQKEDERSRQIKVKKTALLEARKKFSIDALKRKHELADAVDRMRVSNSWGAIDKFMSSSGYINNMGSTSKPKKDSVSVTTLESS